MVKRSAWACLALVAAVIGGAAPAHATRHRFTLSPGPVQLAFRAYSFGIVPINGQFTRFTGTLELDSQDPGFCALVMDARTDSLEMPTQAMTVDAQGTDLLDVERFPTMRFIGRCEGGQLVGALTLHGVTRPVDMEVAVKGGEWTASGMVRRGDWGMGARPMLAGPEVRISIIAGLPASMLDRR